MRVAIYGNLANSAYIEARLLRREGHDVELLLDPREDFVMSDPRWEDLELELPAGSLSAAALPDVARQPWVRAEADADAWARRRRLAVTALRRHRAMLVALRIAGPRGLVYAGIYAGVIDRLSRYDCAIVYGSGPIVAALAGIPFLTHPFGGDITILPFADGDGWQGQTELGTRPPDAEPAIAALQRFGLRRTSKILVGDPAYDSYIDRLGLSEKTTRFGFLIDTDMYAPGPEPELRAKLLGGRDGRIVFVPSRQDWFWKGSDLMLQGFARIARERDDVILVCTGWGADLERSRRLIAELGIGDRIRLLEHAMSKPRLLRYYKAADIVMDQFTLGSYGGSSLEAMSCARPLIMYLESERYASRFATAPPVVDARDPEQIGNALARLLDDPEERAQVGVAGREWVIANHGPVLVRRSAELCAEAVATARQAARGSNGASS
jgi:glycosyltransferase involved in cell wall biosynthesis